MLWDIKMTRDELIKQYSDMSVLENPVSVIFSEEGLRNPQYIPRSIKNEKQRYTNRFVLGGLYFFYYDPKLKAELPYYDKFPLVMPLKRESDGFLGLNLHYLPLRYRIMFMRKLLPFAIYDENDEIKRIRVTYSMLESSSRYKEFKPCIKKYLYNRIQSKIVKVEPQEWDIALYLPIQQFRKERASTVWQESVQDIRSY